MYSVTLTSPIQNQTFKENKNTIKHDVINLYTNLCRTIAAQAVSKWLQST